MNYITPFEAVRNILTISKIPGGETVTGIYERCAFCLPASTWMRTGIWHRTPT